MMLEGAGQKGDARLELRPENPCYFLDGDYILASMGLVGPREPEAAFDHITEISERITRAYKEGQLVGGTDYA
jgi:hypothetical protein